MLAIDPICGMSLNIEETKYKAEVRGKTYYFCSERCMQSFMEGPKIAYFSMEIGIASNIPTYSGGLGILAGDTVRSCADLRIPIAALTLVSRKGYLKQKINEYGEQIDEPDGWDPSKYMRILPKTVTVKIEGRDVKIGAWIYEQVSMTGGNVSILLLDTDLEGNSPEDRRITDRLYGGDQRYRLKQEIVLGIGGLKMLKALDFNITKFHMNEGHSSLLILELLKKNGYDRESTRSQCVFTTHTPVAAAFDIYSYDMVKDMLGKEYEIDRIKEYAGPDGLNMTLLALNLSKYVNGVANTHMASSRKLFPGYHIRSITNGIYSGLWTCRHFREIYDRYIPGWANEPELLVRADGIPNEVIWNAHLKAKRDFFKYIKDNTGTVFDEDALTIGFARRATAYKRATLILSDLDRLRAVNKKGKIQIVFAGKAHPNDGVGKSMIKEIHDDIWKLKDDVKMVYLENYNMDVAAKMVSGVDMWLATPKIPMEASGTSGMKAAHNGVINYSVLDGWWVEGCIEGVTGWSIGPSPEVYMSEEERREQEVRDIYNKLEYIIIPKYYMDRDGWIEMMKNSIAKISYYFNTNRMMRRYATEAYL
ncbi:alpha-glucan family phosphorylase [Methanocella sp. CWC-04]|uniref:Alpha-glucan family phosphorylase n=1 Tax=Methanooceanicella nereidis TaxID=2052831 RepID=A0AAP2RAP3_9EURY|nr:alpha-glucan family phosphorylase [Methanocella sp. CWC-04]MCD1294019.1 alpha-glucan family phosphorylase [Methanocella sp. CWC-04]